MNQIKQNDCFNSNILFFCLEFVNALGEPGTEDSYDDEDEEIAGY